MLIKTLRTGDLFTSEFSREEATITIKDTKVHETLPSSITVSNENVYLLNGYKTEVVMKEVAFADILPARMREFSKIIKDNFKLDLVLTDVTELNILTGNYENTNCKAYFDIQNSYVHKHIYFKIIVKNNKGSSTENFRRIFEVLGNSTAEILKNVEYFEFLKDDNYIIYNVVIENKNI